MTGEAMHAKGAEGIERAKTWLEATMRATVPFTTPGAGQKLTFAWPSKGQFSFDMRGFFEEGELAGQQFLAEVKNYSTVGGQGAQFDEFLCKVYRVIAGDPVRSDDYDRFLWITWTPFRAGKWHELSTPARIAAMVEARRELVLGTEGEIGAGVCDAVANRIWVLVMSDAVETLVPTDQQRWRAQASPSLLMKGTA